MGAAVRARRGFVALASVVAALAAFLLAATSASALDPPTFNTMKVDGRPGQGNLPWSEPRIDTGANGKIFAVTNDDDAAGTAVVFGSTDGGKSFKKTPSPIAGQTMPTPDVDIVVLPSGRLIASELDDAGINFPTSYSDDDGKTWTASVGATQLADQDRQWFAYGPKDKASGQYPVYLLYHNLASGQAQHNMFVSTSTDSGATFGPPIPITLPGDDAYSDLQCADSGGPSRIFVNQRTGTIYAEFTTRAAPAPGGGPDLGGCATAAAGQPFEFNIVAGTRIWLSQSTDGGTTWKNSLAVDDAPTGQIVSMQIAYAGLDTNGNIYVAYPESPMGKQYPNYEGAGVKYKVAAPSNGTLHWGDAKTLSPADPNAPGHVLVHIVVGDPGQIMAAYWTGSPQQGRKPVWHMTAAETTNGLDANPTVTEARLSDIPTDVGTAGELMGACIDAGPVSGVINGLACDRSPDVWGITLTQDCKTAVVWPTRNRKDDPSTPDDDASTVPSGSDPGTFISVQNGGPTLCGSHAGVKVAPPTTVAGGGSSGGGSGGGGTGGAGGTCRDKIAPVSHFAGKKTRTGHRRLHFQGSSSDRGCVGANGIIAAGKVSRVLVSVAKVRGKIKHQTCAFLTSKGTLAKFRSCRKPVLLRAHGTKKWSITLNPRTLPRGSYRVVVRAIDRAKNKERPAKGRNIAAFKLRH